MDARPGIDVLTTIMKAVRRVSNQVAVSVLYLTQLRDFFARVKVHRELRPKPAETVCIHATRNEIINRL
jgi:hypothetical protein